jgi:cytoskeletal protein RodZ
VVARALGTLDLPPYATLDAFCEALVRFSVADLRTTVRGLFHAWEQAVAARRAPVPPPALTISDIRRARRATGLSLDDLSAVADVPAARLRELEWGYLRNWRSDDEGRAQVLRYARAAGLDEAVVLSIAWPMIEEAGALGQEQSEPAAALAPRAPGTMALAAPIASQPSGSRLMSWGVVSVAAALLALATFGAIIARQEPKANRVAASSEPALTPEARPAEVPPPGGPAVTPAAQHVEALVAAGPAVTADAPSVEPAAAAAPAPAAPRRQVAPRPRARPAAAPHRRPAPRHQSFFRKELFRIVIR